MAETSWHPPTPAERALVERWVQEWNLTVGDNATVRADLVAGTSCGCGCPSFSVKPLAIDPTRSSERPLAVEGDARRADGTPAAGLIAWGLDDSVVDFEVFSFGGDPVVLEELSFVFGDHTIGRRA
jgi:hypothetical protein